MAELPPSDAQRAADAQGQAFAWAVQGRRAAQRAAAASRAGIASVGGWDVTIEPLDADFALDRALALLESASMRAGTPSAPLGADRFGAQQGVVERHFDTAASAFPAGAGQRFADERFADLAGPGKGPANSAAAFADGLRAILARRADRVLLAPGVELYDAAPARHSPRARLRVHGLPVAVVRGFVPATGGPVTQWRLAAGGNVASLRVRSLSSQPLRNAAILAAERRAPDLLRWALRPVAAGILTCASRPVLDAWDAIEADLRTGRRTFSPDPFLLTQRRTPSGHGDDASAGFTLTAVAVAPSHDGSAASAPLVLLALGAGIVAQVVWDPGAVDWTGGAMGQGLH